MKNQSLDFIHSREAELGPLRSQMGPDAPERPWSHWQLARDEEGVAWLLLDKKDTRTNVLSRDTLLELGEILQQLKKEKPKALVLRSAKPDNFCVGADINEFRELQSEEDVVEGLKAAHAVADRLARFPSPTIAVIHGNCLGGGLELALCCNYRLAVPGAKLGLPEILLGLHPGLGGTDRLTRLINPIEAMTLMLTGKTLNHRKAKALGVVDAVVDERHVAAAVAAAARKQLRRRKAGLKERLLGTRLARRKAADRMREKSAEKAPPQLYPAPEALISLWEKFGGQARRMREAEIQSFARLLAGSTAKNLIHVFFLREKMKRLGRYPDGAAPVEHLHVIGAGAMGGDIAAWGALQGLRVSLFDKQPAVLAAAVKRAGELSQAKRLSRAQTRDLLDRLIPDHHNDGVAQADLVIEAVPEKIEVKQQVFAEIEPRLKPGAILATNTSSIPLEKLREGLADPGRLVGLHFFNPVAKMQLVEVVQHSGAREEVIARARGFAGQIGKLPTAVSSAPGFLVNRALTPYLLEAVVLLDEGMPAESIDRAAEDFGMPMGPVELADQVGLDVCLATADMLRERLDGAIPQVPGWLGDKVDQGHLGRKAGRGFYKWEKGKPIKDRNPPAAADDTVDRLILPMLNACMACLREGVVEDEDLLDGAMIFGTGFAPFRGGPMRYARSRGFDSIARDLQALVERYGDRFTPDPGWIQRGA